MQTDSTALFLSNIIKLNLVLKEIQNNPLALTIILTLPFKIDLRLHLCPTLICGQC